MKFTITDFSSKCDQIRWKLQIWSHLLKKSLMENFIFCAVPFIYSKIECLRFSFKYCLSLKLIFASFILTLLKK